MATTQVSHGESTRQYWMIGAILAVITIVEVAVSLPGVIYSPEDPDITAQLILVPILLVLSTVKGSMVVMFFMHLKGDARAFKLLFSAVFSGGLDDPGLSGAVLTARRHRRLTLSG